MFMITGAWGSGRNLREDNKKSGDYFTDKRWPRARRLYHHPDNCYNSWPNVIASYINATVHWVGSDDNHTVNTLSTLNLFFNSIEGRYNNGEINYYFIVLNGIYDMQEKFPINEEEDFWTNYNKAYKFHKTSLTQFNRGWDSLKLIIEQSSYNDRMIFIMQDKDLIDSEFRRDDTPSIYDQLNILCNEQEYVYFHKGGLEDIVQSHKTFGAAPYSGPTLTQEQNDIFGFNLYSWLTKQTNCFIM